jgi:putative flippase GtrA
MMNFSFLDIFLFFTMRLLKFGLVGVSGMVVDFGLTWLCKEKLKWNRYLANSIGFSTAVINNFLINRYWTFSDSTVHDTPRQFTTLL